MEYEYKFENAILMDKIPLTKSGARKNYEKNTADAEEMINELSKEGWELFSTHTTAFNTILFILRRGKND
jgi:hypothetical protein